MSEGISCKRMLIQIVDLTEILYSPAVFESVRNLFLSLDAKVNILRRNIFIYRMWRHSFACGNRSEKDLSKADYKISSYDSASENLDVMKERWEKIQVIKKK